MARSTNPDVLKRAAMKRRAQRTVERSRKASFDLWRRTGELRGHAAAWVDQNPERAADIAVRNVYLRARAGAGAAGGVADRLGKTESYRPTPGDQPVKAVPPQVAADRLELRWSLLEGARPITSKKLLKSCKTPAGMGYVGVAGHDGGSHYTGLQSCANVWACPVCAPKIRASRMHDVVTAFERQHANGGGFIFMTLTIAHEHGEALRLLLDILGGAWKSVAEQREYKEWKERLAIIGNITSLEVTDGEPNGWHPHRHVMIFTERPVSCDQVDAFEAVLDELYGRWLVKHGRKRGGVDKQTGRRVGIRLDYVPPDDKGRQEQLGKYITKLQAAYELTRGDLKQSREAEAKKRRLPFDLLKQAVDGAAAGDDVAQLVARWQEYEQAMTGKSAVRFSKGLRALLDMPKGKTDEQLAEEPTDGDPATVYLTKIMFWQLRRDRRAAGLLNARTFGGDDGLLAYIEQHYPGRFLVDEDGAPPGAVLVRWIARNGNVC